MITLRPPQNTEAEIEAFGTTCERLGGFNREITFEWVEGFLAAVAAGPRLPEPAVWLAALCGEHFERAFGDPEDQAQALRSLLARLKVLCDQLDPEAMLDDPDALRFEPLISEYTDADRQQLVEQDGFSAEDAAAMQTGALWAQGFLNGVEALPEVWIEPKTEEAATLFGQAFDQVAALLLPPASEEWREHLTTYYPKDPPTRDELLSEACMSVQDLRLLWVDFALKPETRRVESVPGRNEPCPCGSGKKYKKCHGG